MHSAVAPRRFSTGQTSLSFLRLLSLFLPRVKVIAGADPAYRRDGEPNRLTGGELYSPWLSRPANPRWKYRRCADDVATIKLIGAKNETTEKGGEVGGLCERRINDASSSRLRVLYPFSSTTGSKTTSDLLVSYVCVSRLLARFTEFRASFSSLAFSLSPMKDNNNSTKIR